jgi:hypothetical protein
VTWSRMFLLAVLVLGLTVGAAGVLRLSDDRGPRPRLVDAPATPGGVAVPSGGAVAVLHAWDRRRAQAWAEGDLAVLRGLYTARSVAGVRDVAMLRRWRGRGLVVRDLTTQVLAARVLEHTGDRIVVGVTDRLTRAVAMGSGVRRVLPADLASTWTVTLRRVAGEWLVSAVRALR